MTFVVPIRPIRPPQQFKKKNFIDKICLSPFVSVEISLYGQVSLCGCYHWMPAKIGNIYEQSLQDMLGSPLAVQIRQSIIDGTYIFCNESTCGVIRNNLLNDIDNLPDNVAWQIEHPSRFLMPKEIVLSGDLTCNLSCPSCRTKVIKLSDQEQKMQMQYIEILKNNIFSNPTDQDIAITVSTSGELFASDFLLSFLQQISLRNFPNLYLNLQTNGLLCEKNWHRLGDLQDRVKKITVTIDAAQSDTYQKLRRGGTWDQIMKAMSWLHVKKKQNNMKLHTRCVVQKENYLQLEDFYKLSKSFAADIVEYARISNWNTMPLEDFTEIDIWSPHHGLYDSAMLHLNRIKDLPDVVTWG